MSSGDTISQVFRGKVIHCLNIYESGFKILEDALIGVNKDGTIAFLELGSKEEKLQHQFNFTDNQVVHLEKNKFLIPGLVDTHLHAPQYAIAGTGTDLPLLDWLNKYTFPMESKYSNLDFARTVFTKVVQRTLSYGTTTACYYSSIHLNATKLLADVVAQFGQRAYVGKVCMDQNSPEYYVETAHQSLIDTENFIQYVINKKNPLVVPILTPRFAPTCSAILMHGLSKLSKQYNLPIQSHISENESEVEWVKQLEPQKSYTEVYDQYGLLTNKTVMAHGIYLSDAELKILKDRQSGISHCPVSNFSLHSGILDVRKVVQAGVKVGLGSDISGGYASSLLEVMRQCIVGSNSLQFTDHLKKPLNFREVFAFATIGGAQVLGLDNIIGNFAVGKSFDALLIDPESNGSPIDIFENDQFEDMFQKFIYLGDDRNMEKVFINGKNVSSRV